MIISRSYQLPTCCTGFVGIESEGIKSQNFAFVKIHKILCVFLSMCLKTANFVVGINGKFIAYVIQV